VLVRPGRAVQIPGSNPDGRSSLSALRTQIKARLRSWPGIDSLRAEPPVVLLHGLTASNRYWGAAFDQLAAADSRMIVPDPLGFGASPHPPTGYGPAEHAAAVAGLLSELHADAGGAISRRPRT
jgi:pimeloyl-ACP methyl ester carboxylesterase